MKKIYLIIIMVSMSTTICSHEFMTEILVNSNMTINENNSEFITIETFTFNEDAIINAYKKQTHSTRDNSLLKDRVKLETLKQIMPSHEGAKIILCDDEDIIAEVNATCGQFDHFSMARTAEIKTCYLLANQNPQLYTGPIVPSFSGPNTFIVAGSAAADHHTVYDVADGLSFSCVEVVVNTQ